MNLPIFNPLLQDQSTYITFSKALLDLDVALANDTEYVFSNMVALNIPAWRNPDFFTERLKEIGITSTDPNTVLPAMFQYYMENIIRQNVDTPEITELAFWKTLNQCGLDAEKIRNTISFINKVVTVDFVQVENNNGWGNVICQIPNKCSNLVLAQRTAQIPDVVQSEDTDQCIWDNGNKQFLFSDEQKQVIDFENLKYDTSQKSSFDFNVLLLFYRDKDGVDKLHGINFIYPFENKVTEWTLETLTQKTNSIQTLGYQFLFNLKTCNNEASKVVVYEENLGQYYELFFQTFGRLDSFLEQSISNQKQ